MKTAKDTIQTTLIQKINTIADWVIRIIVINILIIVTSLPIITLYPSFAAGYRLWHDYINKDEPKIISGYFTYFKADFFKKLWMGFILTALIGLGYLNATYYAQLVDTSWLFKIGYYLMIIMLVTGVIVTLFTLVVFQVFPETKIYLMFKLALYLSGKYFFRLCLLFLIMIIPIFMMIFPFTQLMFVFIGVSVPLLLNAMVTNPIVDYLKGLKENAKS